MRTTLLLILFFLAGGLRAADRTDDYLRNKPGGNTLDRGRWEKLKDDYKYKHLKEQKEKKKRKRSDFSLNFGNFDWLNVLAYAAIFLLIVGAIYWLARLGFFGNKALKEEKKGFNIFEDPEDLEQLDVDPLLMAALKMGDYRLAIRLHFLQMLKTLHTEKLITWKNGYEKEQREMYTSHLYSQSAESALLVPEVKPVYNEHSPVINGFEVLNHCFDAALAREPRLFAFGEDLGMIGDVNQGFSGLQVKYGVERVFDVGIREATIIGQGIGMAMRGLRPIAEIQYLDYLLYGLQPMSDDLATLLWRTRGGQKAPLIIRTRGHRLEGVWHSGSPIGMIVNAIRGIYLLVPRNMVQAAGFYNTMLLSDDPALIIECLNGYRLKEKLPDNIGTFTLPLGIPEVLHAGVDVTMVTYGSSCRIAMEAIEKLHEFGISVELIDVQSLLPFDIHHSIVDSIKKTNRVVFLDEDVPGGASAYMMQQVLEVQNGYRYLDAKPVTITAQANRPAYATDGDYFCKPNPEDIFWIVYNMIRESHPDDYPEID